MFKRVNGEMDILWDKPIAHIRDLEQEILNAGLETDRMMQKPVTKPSPG